MPVPAVASKNLTAAGGELPAGTVIGYEIVLVGLTGQPELHAAVGAALIVEAVVDSVCEPEVNVVEVIVKFQPAPLPPLGVFATVRPKE